MNKIVGGEELEDDPEPVATSFKVLRKKTTDDIQEG